MTTSNVAITSTWTQVGINTDTIVQASWDESISVEVAETVTNVVPTVKGHVYSRETGFKRIGAGWIWARAVLVPAPGGPTGLSLVVSK